MKVDADTNDIYEVPPFLTIHGWLMWTSWGILGFIQLLSNRYLKVYWKINRAIHAISGLAITGLVLAFGLLAMQRLDWNVEKDWHNIIGFIVMILVAILALGGILIGTLLNTLRWKTALLMKFKAGHKLFGMLMITLSQISVLTGGLKWANSFPDSRPLVIVHFIVFFLLCILIEGIH